jgi:AraC family transcriptional regulator
MAGPSGVAWAQKDGDVPTTLAAGSAPGESGVAIYHVRFRGAAHLSAVTKHHFVCFATQVRVECRMDGRSFRHDAPAGSLAICPAGVDWSCDAEQSVETLLVAIDPGRFALTAAEEQALETQLIGRSLGYDRALLDLARSLASESADGYPNGPLFWNEVAGRFIDGLVGRYAADLQCQTRGILGRDVFLRLRDYIMAHLDEPIEVATLADIAGRSPFHFSRVFARSVGVTPHRYVVHLRLRRAIELVRDGGSGLADIAARTGFADQSHLSRWARRVYGTSLTRLAA